MRRSRKDGAARTRVRGWHLGSLGPARQDMESVPLRSRAKALGHTEGAGEQQQETQEGGHTAAEGAALFTLLHRGQRLGAAKRATVANKTGTAESIAALPSHRGLERVAQLVSQSVLPATGVAQTLSCACSMCF